MYGGINNDNDNDNICIVYCLFLGIQSAVGTVAYTIIPSGNCHHHFASPTCRTSFRNSGCPFVRDNQIMHRTTYKNNGVVVQWTTKDQKPIVNFLEDQSYILEYYIA